MVFPSSKVAIIATLAKGYFYGFRDCEQLHGIQNLEIDTDLIDSSIHRAIRFYDENKSALENQGIYFFALPNS